MILNVVKQPVRAKYADEWPTLIADFIEASRAEPGCLSFDWCRSADDPNLWVLIETFRDDEAGKAHVDSDHFKKATEQMPRWLAAAPEIIHVEVPGDEWSAVSEGAQSP
jgi:quinol monooxygenase YgiN